MKFECRCLEKEIFDGKKYRQLQLTAILLGLLLLLVACKQISKEDGVSTSNEQEILVLKEELSQTIESNEFLRIEIDKLESEHKSLLASKGALEADLENFKKRLKECDEENMKTIQYYMNFTEYFKYEDYEVALC